MTKKHFIEVAAIICRIQEKDVRLFVAEEMAILFKQLNRLFDKQRFFHACGL